MKKLNSLLACILMLAATTLVDAQTEEEAPPHRTSAQIVDFILTIQEHRVLEMAEVIPENKYSFAPCGEGFAGVRTVAEQLKGGARSSLHYGAPHLSARGTSTLLNNALLSAHFRLADHPRTGLGL